MKVSALRELTRDELLQKKRDLEDELFNLNMRKSLKSLDNPLQLRHIRRDIARLNTLLREDETKLRSLAQSRTSVLDEGKKDSSEKAE